MGNMTEAQKRFADEYLIDLNATRAYRVAYPRVRKDATAAVNGSKLLRNAKVLTYVEERMKEIEDKAIAKQEEVLKYLTSLMRGEQKEETLIGRGEGYQSMDDIDVSAKDRIKAAELLGKRYSMWIDKKELKATFDGVTKLDKIIEQLTDDDAEITEDDL